MDSYFNKNVNELCTLFKEHNSELVGLQNGSGVRINVVDSNFDTNVKIIDNTKIYWMCANDKCRKEQFTTLESVINMEQFLCIDCSRCFCLTEYNIFPTDLKLTKQDPLELVQELAEQMKMQLTIKYQPFGNNYIMKMQMCSVGGEAAGPTRPQVESEYGPIYINMVDNQLCVKNLKIETTQETKFIDSQRIIAALFLDNMNLLPTHPELTCNQDNLTSSDTTEKNGSNQTDTREQSDDDETVLVTSMNSLIDKLNSNITSLMNDDTIEQIKSWVDNF